MKMRRDKDAAEDCQHAREPLREHSASHIGRSDISLYFAVRTPFAVNGLHGAHGGVTAQTTCHNVLD
jgi:hypothetical protein